MSGLYQTGVIDNVNNQLDIRRLMQVIDYRFEKYQENARGIKCFCPIHREGLFRNLVINPQARTFHCQYNQCPGSKGGNLVDLFSRALNISRDEAVRRIVTDQKLDIALDINEDSIRHSINEATAIFESGELADAEAAFLAIIAARPECIDAQEGLFNIYTALGEQEKRKAALISLCRIKVAEGKAGEVAEKIREWADLEPDDQEARSANAEVTLANGEVENAVLEFMGAADAYENTADLEGALKAYRRAEQISLENEVDVIETSPHIVRVLHQLGQHEEANSYLVNLANLAIVQNDYARAVELLLPTVRIPQTPPETLLQFLEIVFETPLNQEICESIFHCTEIFIRREERNVAIAALEKLHQTLPSQEEALRRLINEYYNVGKTPQALDLEATLAVLFYDSGRKEEAFEITERVLTWQPSHIRMLETLATFQTLENRDAEAIETRRRFIRALLEYKQYDTALEQTESLLRNAPDNNDYLELKARALEGIALSGDKETVSQARTFLEELGDSLAESTNGKRSSELYERAAKLYDTPSHEIHFKLARSYFRIKRYDMTRDNVILACEILAGADRLDEAILEAERYSNLMPEESDLVRYLAELYLRFDDKSAAIARLKRLAEDLTAAGRTDEANEVLLQAKEFEPQTPEELLRHANELLEENKSEKYTSVMLRAASAYQTDNRHTEAAETLIQMLSKRPEHTPAVEMLIPILEKLSRGDEVRRWQLHLARSFSHTDKEKSIAFLKAVLEKNPEDDEVLELLQTYQFQSDKTADGVDTALKLADIHTQANRHEQAKKVLVSAAEFAPTNTDIMRNLLSAYTETKQIPQAVTWGKKLISQLTIQQDIESASEAYENLTALDPNNLQLLLEQLNYLQDNNLEPRALPVRLKLANHYISQERFGDAEELLLKCIAKSSRDTDCRLRLIELYEKTGEAAKAEGQRINLAGVYNITGDSAAAIKLLKDVLADNPNSYDGHRHLSQIYRSSNMRNEAIQQLQALADIYRANGMEIDAIAVERDIVELTPDDITVRIKLANSLNKSGHARQACEELEQIAAAQVAEGKTEEALAIIEDVLKIDETRVPARKIRADIYKQSGDQDKTFEELLKIAEIAAEKFATPDISAIGDNRQDQYNKYLALVKEYDFTSFVVGAKNDFAYATALAIARSPARAYNPFFLYADVGLGKTHLCNAIANHILENNPKALVLYTNSEDFTGELVDAIQNNAIQQFRDRYRNLDLLIVDDVQFLAGKERAQEEFFHIFNALFHAKKQIVITSDRPPSEISHLESRLRSRFGAGVIVDIASPDLETRNAIVLREIETNKLDLEPWVASQLAEHVTTNVRDLKSALNQVVALRDLKKIEITKDSVQEMLDKIFPREMV